MKSIKTKEWMPPERPKVDELRRLVKRGWTFNAGYLYDYVNDKIITDKNEMVVFLLSKKCSAHVLPMVYFKMVCEN